MSARPGARHRPAASWPAGKGSTARDRHSTSILLVILLVLLALPAARASAESAFSPLFRADPAFLAAAANARPLSSAELAELALEASGIGPLALPRYRERLDTLLSGLDKALGPRGGKAGSPGGDETALAEAALAWLHDSALKSYSTATTTLDTILDTGRFNCVSSAVLYVLALKRLGMTATGVRTSDHAFVQVHSGGRDIDVETTNRYGFDPGTKKEFADSFGKVTGFNYVPPANYRDRQALGERELVALVLSNRVTLAEEAGDFRGALALASDFAALMGATEAGRQEGRKLVIDCVNNLAAALQSSSDWSGIETLVREALLALGPEPRLAVLLQTALRNRVLPLLGGDGWRAGLLSADAARGAGELDLPTWLELVDYAYSAAAQRKGQAGDWLGAAALADEGLSRIAAADAGNQAARARADLVRAAELSRRNFVVTAHNRFAALYNGRDYAAARKAVEEALALMPSDPTLLADLEASKKAMAR